MKKIILLILTAALLITVQPLVKMEGLLKQIDVDGNKLCGVNGANLIFCKTSLNAPWQIDNNG